MKRTFTYISIPIIAAAALFFFASSSHAQDYTELNFESTELNEAVLQAGQTGTQLQTATQQAKKQTEACASYGSTFTKPIECGLLPGIADLMLTFASKFLYLAGIFFNFSMAYTLNLAAQVENLQIGAAWSIIRDLVNIGFIFALLWIAIQTILEMGDWKRPLISIIIAALLINFSLFFTKVIIDVSNTFALQFYSSITGGQFLAPESSLDGGISDQFVKRLQLTGIYKTTGSGSLSFGEISAVAIFGSIFLLVTAGVFFVAGLLFLARSAILIMLMVLSPIGFIGGWLPRFGSKAKDWWETLFKECLSAPVFLLIIWVVLKITDTGKSFISQNVASVGASGNATFADVFAGTSGAVGIVFYFLLLIAFTIFALNQAKSLSSSFSNSFTGWAQKKLGAGASGVLSGTGFLGRQSVGRLAARIAENQTVRGWAGQEGTLGRLSMLGLRSAEGVAKSSFDVRNAPLVGAGGIASKGLGSALKLGGADIDLGKAGGAGGFRKTEKTAIDERAKARQEQSKLLEFKESDEQKRARQEAGDTRNARQITEERQRAFAASLKSPTIAGRVVDIATGKPFTGFKGDLEGAKKIEKTHKDTGKLEADKEKLTEKLEGLLKEFNGGISDATEENIENAITAANIRLARAQAEAEALRPGASINEISTKKAAVLNIQTKLQNLRQFKGEIEKISEKIDKLKKDGDEGSKKGEKKDEEKKDDKK